MINNENFRTSKGDLVLLRLAHAMQALSDWKWAPKYQAMHAYIYIICVTWKFKIEDPSIPQISYFESLIIYGIKMNTFKLSLHECKLYFKN